MSVIRAVRVSLSIALFLLLSAPIQAQTWTLLSDFESATLGDPDGQESWTNISDNAEAYTIVVDPADESNQVLEAGFATGGDAYLTLPDGGFADGTTNTVFFRMRNEDPGDLVFGSSDVAAPAAWGDYEGYQVFVGGSINVRNGGTFDVHTPYESDEWTNVWLVLDNDFDGTDIYTSVGDAAEPETGPQFGDFRNGTDDALVTLNLRMGAPQADAIGYVDDIYFASGTLLSNPLGTVTTPTCAVPAGRIPGDLDGVDGVAFADFLTLSANFGSEVSTYEQGDIDCNGAVEFADFLALSENFGQTEPAGAASVPEPSGLALIFFGCIFLLGRRDSSKKPSRA